MLTGGLWPSAAGAAEPPQVDSSWATAVSASAATVHAEVNPEGLATSYRFEYIPAGPDYEAHGFEHALREPKGGEGGLGSGTSDVEATQHLVPLAPATTYQYRIAATSTAGTTFGPDLTFTTQQSGESSSLPDSRGWEMVSPVDKNGGAIQGFEGNYGGDVLQAAAAGGAITYSSASAFGSSPPGVPPASQYIARREVAGWSTQNVTAPTLSGAYGTEPDGVPYRIFSADLTRGLMLEGRRCEEGEPCPRPYSIWEAGAFTPLPAEAAGTAVIGASPDLRHIRFEDEAGQAYEWSGGPALSPIATPPLPETEPTRLSADGETMLFLSTEPLTGYDNTDPATGEADSEVFLSHGGGPPVCLSCNPTGERPLGPSTIPGAIANGSTRIYRPRALSADGRRAFFDSADALVSQDSDGRPDVYEWEAQGEGSCAKPGGCLALISGGRSGEASFIDASESGGDAFFLTEASLVGQDPGSVDLYDAREGGGISEAPVPFECLADACQPLPEPPEDPTVGTTIPGPANPPPRLPKAKCPKGKRRVVKHGKVRCVVKKHHRRKRGRR